MSLYGGSEVLSVRLPEQHCVPHTAVATVRLTASQHGSARYRAGPHSSSSSSSCLSGVSVAAQFAPVGCRLGVWSIIIHRSDPGRGAQSRLWVAKFFRVAEYTRYFGPRGEDPPQDVVTVPLSDSSHCAGHGRHNTTVRLCLFCM